MGKKGKGKAKSEAEMVISFISFSDLENNNFLISLFCLE